MVHDLIGSQRVVGRVHAHVKRGVLVIGEAALGNVELGRAHAQIEQEAIDTGNLGLLQQTVELGEVALELQGPQLRQLLVNARAGVCQGKVVLVDADEHARGAAQLAHLKGVAGAAERAVAHDVAVSGAQRLENLVKHDGDVMKFNLRGFGPGEFLCSHLLLLQKIQGEQVFLRTPIGSSVANLEMVPAAHDGDVLVEAHDLAQPARDADATGRVNGGLFGKCKQARAKLHVARGARVEALAEERLDPCVVGLGRKDVDRLLVQRQDALHNLRQIAARLGRKRDTALCVERVLGNAGKARILRLDIHVRLLSA